MSKSNQSSVEQGHWSLQTTTIKSKHDRIFDTLSPLHFVPHDLFIYSRLTPALLFKSYWQRAVVLQTEPGRCTPERTARLHFHSAHSRRSDQEKLNPGKSYYTE
ncbi:hypothetical protein chiPu_0004294 [Chiloscyllium punctatum]|uniref:Uncharacterized protein n=1 Tax=Chiloscyllium punctatum TaxID=137246 RepID=A0A401S668_CHIPU|nr:hypothetical protein [Chiloscyllium punctatum]